MVDGRLGAVLASNCSGWRNSGEVDDGGSERNAGVSVGQTLVISMRKMERARHVRHTGTRRLLSNCGGGNRVSR